ncbi:alpha/beta hydrolase [Deinococcus indicus]|uniref:Alpha/beta hydrolase n=1 Tax=Deinococcus indicus TaxID=223556 RepID=A0A246BGM2_9DEIO|nr:alpha/beta hydrolase [Deinococcus indicus]OWL94375.1 alpha/beta hydrolase [Deinococcus indicus]GHG14549.1 alpha/beta hydrolase [Deinococcus indicus]
MMRSLTVSLLAALALAACSRTPTPAETRTQDTRTFTAVTPALTARTGAQLYQGKMPGLRGEAAYAIEVPATWNGQLVMYTHGYAGDGPELRVQTPPLRDYWLSLGYAWAASSYSANYYDVQAGVEDTNALANAFAALTGRARPTKTLIMGVSMGGHVAAAAVEKETAQTAKNRTTYAAAMPVCGVMDEEYEFQWLGDYTLVAAHLAGLGAKTFPQGTDTFKALLPDILNASFSSYSGALWQENATQGAKLREIARNLTGGPRPVFDLGFRVGALQGAVLSTGGSDGTLTGILPRNTYGNATTTYRWTTAATPTAAEVAFNASVLRVTPAQNPNPALPDRVRYLPRVNGEFSVPVLTLHTTGDFYVPFRHQQLYRAAATAAGNGDRLVQRAVRAPGHCDFTAAELVEGFGDLVKWEAGGARPAGDDVTTPAVIAEPTYGCRFTRGTRAGVDACPAN